jgi:hypothetical protein
MGLTALEILWIFTSFTTRAHVSSLFWDVMQRRLVVSYLSFATTFQSRNVGTQVPTMSNIREEQRSYLQRGGSLKSLSITGNYVTAVDHEVEKTLNVRVKTNIRTWVDKRENRVKLVMSSFWWQRT